MGDTLNVNARKASIVPTLIFFNIPYAFHLSVKCIVVEKFPFRLFRKWFLRLLEPLDYNVHTANLAQYHTDGGITFEQSVTPYKYVQ